MDERLSISLDNHHCIYRLVDRCDVDANKGAKIKQDEILMTDVVAGQATAAYHEAVFQQVLALAGLERITAGGFNSGLAK